jgi:hypothetical protein
MLKKSHTSADHFYLCLLLKQKFFKSVLLPLLHPHVGISEHHFSLIHDRPLLFPLLLCLNSSALFLPVPLRLLLLQLADYLLNVDRYLFLLGELLLLCRWGRHRCEGSIALVVEEVRRKARVEIEQFLQVHFSLDFRVE